MSTHVKRVSVCGDDVREVSRSRGGQCGTQGRGHVDRGGGGGGERVARRVVGVSSGWRGGAALTKREVAAVQGVLLTAAPNALHRSLKHKHFSLLRIGVCD